MAEFENSHCSKDTELTMCDVLEEEQELEDDANAVLGGSDDTNCSYDKGYVPRQALYACLTCSNNHEPAGVCLACSYKCHDGHDIVELYTKRNFRCDCGNSKFPERSCILRPEKDPLNSLNRYNQNFKGVYCNCSRPYPDPEDNTPDEMIQCIMCEDWFHGRHLGGCVPDDYFEMICVQCMESHKFLYLYLNKFQYVDVIEGKASSCNEKDSFIKDEKKHPDELCNSSQHNGVSAEKSLNVGSPMKFSDIKTKPSDSSDIKTKPSDSGPSEEDKKKLTVKSESGEECLLKVIRPKPDGISSGPAFWPENWRKELCRCSLCTVMYRKNGCEYLIKIDDTILAYEERGKSGNENQYDKGMSALGQLDRVKQMEAVRAYTNMKGQLKEYLKEFANNKRTVCESDIKEFFERMKKKQKSNHSVPHFCR